MPAQTVNLILILLFLFVAIYYFIMAKKKSHVKYVWAAVFFLGLAAMRIIPALGLLLFIAGVIGYFMTRSKK